MRMKAPGSYESFFGLRERPFSLTPDTKYFFASRSHGTARETLIDGLRRGERFLMVTGDLGVGKTSLCRMLIPELRAQMPVSFIANPLLTPSGLFRLLLEDFDAVSEPALADESPAGTPHELRELIVAFLERSRSTGSGAVILIDEAHSLPVSVVEQLLLLGALHNHNERPLQLVLVGQPQLGEPASTGVRALNEHVSTKARLTPLGRDECAAYVEYRLTVANARSSSIFTSSAIDMLYALSGGVPRLLNLLAERALQEAAAEHAQKVGPGMIDVAAASLELLRGSTRRFRWFTRRVS